MRLVTETVPVYEGVSVCVFVCLCVCVCACLCMWLCLGLVAAFHCLTTRIVRISHKNVIIPFAKRSPKRSSEPRGNGVGERGIVGAACAPADKRGCDIATDFGTVVFYSLYVFFSRLLFSFYCSRKFY